MMPRRLVCMLRVTRVPTALPLLCLVAFLGDLLVATAFAVDHNVTTTGIGPVVDTLGLSAWTTLWALVAATEAWGLWTHRVDAWRVGLALSGLLWTAWFVALISVVGWENVTATNLSLVLSRIALSWVPSAAALDPRTLHGVVDNLERPPHDD